MPSDNTPEFTALWNEWLHTDDGAGYQAGWSDYATQWHAERGRVWVLRKMLERREAENDRLRAELAVESEAHALEQQEAVNQFGIAEDARGEVERLRAERDAVLRWAVKYGGRVRPFPASGPNREWVAFGDGGTTFGATAEEAVRRAAGLDQEGD